MTVTGGSGNTFGSWTEGAITIGNGNLTFAGGNTALGDKISVDGGKGTVFNNDPLMIAARQKITGKFNQSAMGSLIFGLAGDMAGQYGALDISGSASLAGGLGFDLTNDFTLAAGDTFDDLLMSGGALSGLFRAPVARWRPLLGDICRRLALQQRRARSRSQHRERRARRGRSQRRRARLRRR